MRRSSLLVVGCLLALAGCNKSAAPSQPPAMSPPVQVSEKIIASDGYVDRPLDDAAHSLDVAFANGQYLVVWTQATSTQGDDIFASRVTLDGQVLDGSGFDVSSAAGDEQAPAVASDGKNWLVVWQDHRSGQYVNIYAARVAPDGTLLDQGGIVISPQAPNHQLQPAVAFDGTNYLVVWADHRNGNWDIYGARVTPDGTVLDANGFPIAVAANQQQAPSIAFDGVNYLVVFQDQRTGDANIGGARVSPAGVVLDPSGLTISGAPNVQSGPELVYDGASYVVAWQDLRTGVADIYAARVQTDGTVLDPNGIAVSAAASAQTVPAISFDGEYVVSVWEDARSGVGTDVYGARLDLTAAVLDPNGFLVASGTNGKATAIASDGAGRAIVAYDALDPSNGAVHLRVRALTDWALLSVAKAGRGGGSVASTPAGIDCGATCSSRFDAPTSVTLTPTPDGNSVFGSWSGACSGGGACTVTVDSAKSVTATFLPLYAVNVALAGPGGTVTSTPGGISCGPTCSARFVEGSGVQLSPKGAPGVSVFSAWTGDCSGTDANACMLTMDGPKAVTATFVPAYTITLTPSGSGVGTLAVGGSTCATGAICPADAAAGTTATITATPDAASVLKNWSGCLAPTDYTCAVSMTSSKTIGAKFEPSSFVLTAQATGAGGGSITGAGLACATGSTAGCTIPVQNPALTVTYNTVTLTDTPDLNSVFKSWSGPCIPVTGAPNTCTVTMSAAKSVGAKFEARSFSLTASTTGIGTGNISGAGLNCTTGSSAGCSASVDNLANSVGYNTVTLTATPDASSVFKSWTGCFPVDGAPNTCTVYASGAKSVSAKFEPATWQVGASRTSNGGDGALTGGGLNCSASTPGGCAGAIANPANTISYNTVTFTATPDANSSFKSWSGCIGIPGTGDCTLMVNGPKTFSAKFEPSTFPLTVATSGAGGGSVGGGGVSCGSGSTSGCSAAIVNPTNTTSYTSVTLAATGDASSVFKSWSGACIPLADPSTCSIIVSGPKSVAAKFEPNAYPLTASLTGTGGGTISGAGLSCSTVTTDGCASTVANPPNTASYTTVTLAATPDASSVFKSWATCISVPGTPSACTIMMNAAKAVSARFEPSAYALTASTTGTGGGTISGAGLSCTTGAADGCATAVANPAETMSYSNVTLTATADGSSVFKSWAGCFPATGAPETCTISVNGAKSVSAKFEPSAYTLTASTASSGGVGTGTITGAGLSCATGATVGCSVPVPNPADTVTYSTVTLTATPDAGFVVTGWSGCIPVPGAPNTCAITMNAAKSVSATFGPATYPVTVSFSGTGAGTISGAGLSCTTGSPDGCAADEANGAFITLTATPSSGSVFAGWLGPCYGTDPTCSVPMVSAKTVRASFNAL